MIWATVLERNNLRVERRGEGNHAIYTHNVYTRKKRKYESKRNIWFFNKEVIGDIQGCNLEGG